jgi:hypothetical protein
MSSDFTFSGRRASFALPPLSGGLLLLLRLART